MLKQQFEAARALIQDGEYDEARAILNAIDHPKAQDWLDKIDALDIPSYPEPILRSDGRLHSGVALMLFVILIIVGLSAWTYYQSTIGPAQRLLDAAIGR